MITRLAVLLPCGVLVWAIVNCSSAPAPAIECCPRDPTIASSMHLGGSKLDDSSCGRDIDFFCTSRWRVEKDENGCEIWRYDTRIPAPADALFCIMRDAGHDAAGAEDASADAASAEDASADAADALTAPDAATDANYP